jgi:transcriptional regulator with XRE-family HTH domain
MTAELSVSNLSEIAAPVQSHLDGRGGWSLREAALKLSEPRNVQTNFCANYAPTAKSLNISITSEGHIFLGENAIQNYWVGIFTHAYGTTLPLVCVHRPEGPIRDSSGIYKGRYLHRPHAQEEPVRGVTQSIVQDLIEQVRANSGLTLEEISPLLGVSRRSLQHWLSGRQISARNEQRLRALADTLCSLPAADSSNSRHRLLQRKSDGVRAYDLLAEGQFSAAYALITGEGPTPEHIPSDLVKLPSSSFTPLIRMSILHGGPASVGGRVDVRRSGRLKR